MNIIRNIPGIAETDVAITSRNNRKSILPDKNDVKDTLIPKDKEDRRNACIAAGGLATLAIIGVTMVHQLKSLRLYK